VDRAEHAALAAAHLVQAFTQVVTIQQRRVLKTAPHLIEQIPVLPGGPRSARPCPQICMLPTSS